MNMSDFLSRKVVQEGMTANGDYPSNYVNISGDHSIALHGTFDGATVQIIFHTIDSAGNVVELPALSDLTYTAPEGPYFYRFPRGMPIKIRVSGAGLNTDISMNVHSFETDI